MTVRLKYIAISVLVIAAVQHYSTAVVLAQVASSTDDQISLEQEVASSSTINTNTRPASDSYRIEALPYDEVIGDFVLSPGRVELQIEPGQTRTVEISVANRIGKNQVFSIDVEDIGVSNDPKRAVDLLGGAVGPYTLKDYISIPQREFGLDHAKRAIVPITISVPPDAEPSGHYGSVLLKTVTKEASSGQGGTAPSSAIISRIGTLFFVTVPGEVSTGGQLQDFSTRNQQHWFDRGPIDFDIVYENTGSIHLNPYGEIRISNLLGEEVGFVELTPWFVLPQSIRLREISFDRELLFGRYTATLNLNRGYDDVIDTSTVVFWVLPWKLIALGVFGLFICLCLLRFLFRTFEFKRKS